MFKKKIVVPLLCSFILTGCDFLTNIIHKPEHKPDEISKRTGGFYGGLVEGEKYTGFEFSILDKEISKPSSGTTSIKIYGFNDFHGAVNETESEAGLVQFGSYLKTISQQENTLVFDQGDTWQGSFESNVEYGKLVQDVFKESNVSLRTIGNHDFDWGETKLESLCDINSANYIPTLGANIYDYVDGKNGTHKQLRFGKEYATFVLESGVKVGVVGVIGQEQITSISSQLVADICFTNQIEKVKEISDFLRVEKSCDIVVASTHDMASQVLGRGLTNESPVSGKRYVDLVLNGHSHTRRKEVEDNVVFMQWDSNGITSGCITLEYDFATKKVVDENTKVNSYNKNYLKKYYPIDSKINSMVSEYLNEIKPIGSKVLSSNFEGYFSEDALSNLMCEAIYDKCESLFENVDFTICNYPREVFSKTEMLYSDLYKCFPFDNQIILMDVSGREAVRSIENNFHYRGDTSLRLNNSSTYRIAVLDYVGLHQNSNREYDYFPNSQNISVLGGTLENVPIYRDILEDYLLKNPDKVFSSSEYDLTNKHFSLY